MGGENFADLIAEVQATRDALASGDTERDRTIKQIKADVDRLTLKVNRPGMETVGDDAERKSAIGLCLNRHNLRIPKNDGAADYEPSPGEVDEAITTRKAIRKLFRHGDSGKLDHLERKSLSSFSFGSSGFFSRPS